ncbi:hypothetical protein QFC21_004459 [Naganishia friedmannii]|uniref:Uncharacterized protein n=1 Tax=Naganishia friedmannii TaxID=89922 RepID=A0ACC2VGU5_9TREE|nr:hypothetical protein QFC21_004459 [Naganishia friedmannii]
MHHQSPSPIINATYSDDGSVQDICRALSLRLRETNAVVVFKALIVLHSMIRSGATDNVLSFLGQQDILRLKNVVGQSWDGYAPPQNLGFYAQYLDSRIRGYRELKHDPIRVQSENNRSSRVEGPSSGRYDGASSRARKLKSLTVDKGLLREVKEVQKMVNAVVLCKFYEDDLSDQCTVMAFRMLVKDLLVLVQAVNEGVVNLLEHYFEMAKTDAREALGIYKTFCKQNDKVVEYLDAARRLHHVVEVPVPNLKHAPVSLVKALEEYLNDPNFEQNRLEYQQNMGVADIPTTAGGSASTPAPAKPSPPVESRTVQPQQQQETASASAPPPKAQQTVNQSIQDFFASIENESGNQANNNNFMMNPYGQPNPMMLQQQQQQQQQPMINPFRQSMMAPQMTGFPAQNQSLGMNSWAQHPNGRMMAPQSTGFIQQQQQQSPFLQPQQTGYMAAQQPQQQSPFMQPQSTGFLQPTPTSQPAQPQQNAFGSMGIGSGSAGMQQMMPQATGPNPFRQTMLFPQSTGAPFQPSAGVSSNPVTLPPQPQTNNVNIAKPLSVQPTGSKNPFALPPDHERKPSPQSAGPSLFQLSQIKASTMPTQGGNTFDSVFGNNFNSGNNTFTNEFGALTMNEPTRNQHSPFHPAQHNTVSGTGAANNSAGTAMSDLASAFTFSSNNDANKQTSQFGNGMSAFGTGMSSNTTGANSSSSSAFGQQGSSAFGSSASAPLQPQPTGFAGSSVKPFKPSSNFGSSLVETLPPLPASSTGTPVGNNSSNTSNFSQAFSSTGPTSPLAAQATGFNPFSSNQPTGMNGGGANGQANGNSSFMSIFGQQQGQNNPSQATGNNDSVFMNAFSTGSNNNWMTAGHQR